MNDAELVERYIQYRDFLQAEQEAFDARTKRYRDAMELIGNAVQANLLQRGDESVKTAAGTAYLSKTLSCHVRDREALFNFVREADAFELLVAGVAKDQVKQYMEEHQGALPPGVEATFVQKCNFRRA